MTRKRQLLFAVLIGLLVALVSWYFFGKKSNKESKEAPILSVVKIKPKDTPMSLEFVGQTQSSHQVEIRARVNGFLDKRTYVEGKPVKTNEVMFKMDPKPFQAQLEAQKAALAEQEAKLRTAQANLARVKPLVKLNALSQKDLDDATGQEQSAAAARDVAKANVLQAELNLSYTDIYSPISGLSSYARVQEGSYINPQNNLMTYVYQMDPIWVNFSVSENDVLKYRGEANRGLFRAPVSNAYTVEIILADGSSYPEKGKITFTDAEYNQNTGTFLVRATFSNPKNMLLPGQFLRVKLLGGVRPNAVLLPQKAVLKSAQGHFVWVVDKDNKAQIRDVELGPAQGDNWFIDKGLKLGDLVILDGTMRLNAGMPVVTVAVK